MIERVEVLEADTVIELENKINRKIAGEVVKDIKFCINPNIETGYAGMMVGDGVKYCAMIIYEGFAHISVCE